MNREEIKKIIPHREPMLLVDEAYVTGENEAKGVYHVKGDEWFLQGHFPGNPGHQTENSRKRHRR